MFSDRQKAKVIIFVPRVIMTVMVFLGMGLIGPIVAYNFWEQFEKDDYKFKNYLLCLTSRTHPIFFETIVTKNA